MRCPNCRRQAPAEAAACICGYSFADDRMERDDEAVTRPPSARPPASTARPGRVRSPTVDDAAHPAAALAPGDFFDNRYRVIRLIGAGGMGAVYQAWDDQLGVVVAIKTVRPELSADPRSAEELDRRFRRELLLARQITHKNIVRIHDLGEVDGIKYLTMPFVQGTDLAMTLRHEGRLTVDRMLPLARQMVAGLGAAHDAGVIHHDLKPANMMIDDAGQLQIVDFGIARSDATSGALRGGIVGTVEYMAPEQLNGQQADHRSDIYALGLVFYEMLAGHDAAIGPSGPSLSALVARRQQRPQALRSLGLLVPEALDQIVKRCLEPDPARRFRTVRDLEAALSRLDAFGHPVLVESSGGLWFAGRRWHAGVVASAAVVAVALAAAAVWIAMRGRSGGPAATPAPVTVLIAEFDNRSNDPIFDGVIEQALGVALESASFVTAYPRRDAIRVANEMRPGARIDESVARLIAMREGIQVVVPGAISRNQSRYEFSIQAIDAASGKVIVTAATEAAGKDQVLAAVGKLAVRIRRGLGDATPDPTQAAAAETFTATSLEAAHAYALAQDAFYAGKTEDAIRLYGEATWLDPEMGRAYAGLASVYLNLNRRTEADRYYQLALARLDRMSEREKFRTLGVYYLFRRNPEKAIEEFSGLVKAYPYDSAALANLALAIFYTRDMSRALEEGRRASAIYPKNVIRRNNVALYAMYGGDFAGAEREAAAVLQLSAGYPKALIATALSQFALGRRDDAVATYRKLAEVSAAAASYASAGLADLSLYEGRVSEAVEILDRGIVADVEAKNPGAVASKKLMLASVRLALGRTAEAGRLLDEAVGMNQDPPVRFLAGHLDIELGRKDKALVLATELERSVESDPVAYGLLLRGEVALAGNDPRAAIDFFEQAKKRADTWFGRFDLGRANLSLGRFAEASSELELCLTRRGEATALFLDEVPTYRVFPAVYYYLGQVKEGLKSPAAVDSYRTFLAIKEKADPAADPLVRAARARLASLR